MAGGAPVKACPYCGSTRAWLITPGERGVECYHVRACERRRFRRMLDDMATLWQTRLAIATDERDAAARDHKQSPNERTVNAQFRAQANVTDAQRALTTIETIREKVKR